MEIITILCLVINFVALVLNAGFLFIHARSKYDYPDYRKHLVILCVLQIITVIMSCVFHPEISPTNTAVSLTFSEIFPGISFTAMYSGIYLCLILCVFVQISNCVIYRFVVIFDDYKSQFFGKLSNVIILMLVEVLFNTVIVTVGILAAPESSSEDGLVSVLEFGLNDVSLRTLFTSLLILWLTIIVIIFTINIKRAWKFIDDSVISLGTKWYHKKFLKTLIVKKISTLLCLLLPVVIAIIFPDARKDDILIQLSSILLALIPVTNTVLIACIPRFKSLFMASFWMHESSAPAIPIEGNNGR